MDIQSSELPTRRLKVESLIPGITHLKDFQWETAIELKCGKRIFLMKPCGSGKTFIWVAFSVEIMITLKLLKESQAVTVVYAPMNEIINDQMRLINSIEGMQGICFKDDPDGARHALSNPSISTYTIIFYNPHISNTEAFVQAIRNSVKNRIRLMAHDEGGIVTKWGASDTFRPVLRQQRRYLHEWFSISKKLMPFILFTGAANSETRALLNSYFLDAERWPNWDIEIIESPFGDDFHIAINVVCIPTREKVETRMVSRIVKEKALEYPPPNRILVLTDLVKDVNKQASSLLTTLNPDRRRGYTESVVAVFAHDSCVNRETDLERFVHGQESGDINQSGFQGIIPRFCVSSFGFLIAGWNCHDIPIGVSRGQPDSLEDFLQALNRLARGGNMNFGEFICVVSYERRLEQVWRRFDTMYKLGATRATINASLREIKMINAITRTLLFSDLVCIVVLVDKAIIGEMSTIKECSVRLRNNQKLWCSSCKEKDKNLGVIHELSIYVTKWYGEKQCSVPTGTIWSEIVDGEGDAVKTIQAKCLHDFLVDQNRPHSGGRAGCLAEIRKMLAPPRLERHIVRDIIIISLPDSQAIVTMGSLQVQISQDTGVAIEIAKECIQRLILNHVLNDRPPANVTVTQAVKDNGSSWLIQQGDLFNQQSDWPLLQRPARPTSWVSRRQEARSTSSTGKNNNGNNNRNNNGNKGKRKKSSSSSSSSSNGKKKKGKEKTGNKKKGNEKKGKERKQKQKKGKQKKGKETKGK